MSEASGAPWPKEVRRMAGEARAVGLDPVVRGVPGGEWVVVVEGKHVRAAAVYGHKNGRTTWLRGELSVDGVSRPPAETQHELRALWDKHEVHEASGPPGLIDVADPAGRPPPPAVREAIRQAEMRLYPVTWGLWDGHWVVGLDCGNGDGLRLIFTGKGREWALDPGRPMQVFAGGEDKTDEAAGDVGRAMALLSASRPPEGAAAPARVRQQAGARDNGVETRRRVVIREHHGPFRRSGSPALDG
jgi:hypothetical protein